MLYDYYSEKNALIRITQAYPSTNSMHGVSHVITTRVQTRRCWGLKSCSSWRWILFAVHVLNAPADWCGIGRSLWRRTAADALAGDVHWSRMWRGRRSRRNELASFKLGTLVDVLDVRPATCRLRGRLDAERQHADHRHGPLLAGVRHQAARRRRRAVGGVSLQLPRLEVVILGRRTRRVARVPARRRRRAAGATDCRLERAGHWGRQVATAVGVVSDMVVMQSTQRTTTRYATVHAVPCVF